MKPQNTLKRWKLFAFLAVIITISNANSQCQENLSITSTTISTATCPSNGNFTIYTNVGTGLTYQITAGPVGYPTGAQSSSTFDALLPGTYTVKVTCALDPSIFTTTTVEIPSTYIPIESTSLAADVCVGAGAGGVINTTINAASASPYSYAYWIGNPAENDLTLNYQVTNSTSLTNAHAVTDFGSYNVRTRDACGVFVTREVTVARDIPQTLCVTRALPTKNGLTCTDLSTSINLTLSFSTNITTLPAGKSVEVEIYENTGTCASPVQGALLQTETFTRNSPNNPVILVPNFKNLIFVTKTPCGDVCTYCYQYSASQQQPAITFRLIAKGCPASEVDPIPYSIILNGGTNYVFPVTFTLKNSSGVDVPGSPYTANSIADMTYEFTNLPSDTYTVAGTDACGAAFNYVMPPPSGSPNNLSVSLQAIVGCTSVEGRTTIRASLSGLMANFGNAVVTIVAGPNLIGVAGTNNGTREYEWKNAIPGATYTIEVDNLCGTKVQLPITVPLSAPVLDQHTTATVQQLCGGTGNITIVATNNSYGTFSFNVRNSSNTIVGAGGIPGLTISNLPPDTYTVTSNMIGCIPYSYNSTVEILPAGQGPVITKKLGVICEDLNGDPTGTGNALLAFTGAKPLKFEYRLTSETDFITLTSDSDGQETISGLAPYTSYTFRVTDNCGNSTVTQVSIGQLEPVTVENTLQPCVGSPYSLTVPDMIDATYSWTKNGLPVSSQRTINFNPYLTSDDGTYICTISILGGCVIRVVTVNLNSTNCNQPLPVNLISFTAKLAEDKTLLTWTTSNEKDFSHFEIEKSSDAKFFSKIGIVYGIAGGLYTFSDKQLSSQLQYYRLKMIDLDGTFAYSRVVSLHFGSVKSVNVYPNPVSQLLKIQVTNNESIQSVEIIDLTGKTVYRKLNGLAEVLSKGIDISKLQHGSYVLRIKEANGVVATSKIIVVR